MLPPAFDVDRALTDVHWLVEEVGPRPTGGEAEAAAAAGVRARLEAAGWTVQAVGLDTNLVACRGSGRSLFLAHIDSVQESPGAGDNAAGVALLLELARTSAAADLCLGFPAAEEVGLHGSRRMANELLETRTSWLPPGGALELVVSLDLVGWGDQGAGGPEELVANGLGPGWDGAALRWLLDRGDAAGVSLGVPYGYRTMSRAAPWMERSDHAAFSELARLWLDTAGGPTDAPPEPPPEALSPRLRALHLLHVDAHTVFPHYHQPEDTVASGPALAEAAALLEALATAEAPPPPRDTDASWVLGRWVVPAWLTWGIFFAGLASGARDWRQVRHLPGQLWRGAVVVGGAALATALLPTSGLLATAVPEATAAAVYGLPSTGWWAAAPWALLLGGLVFFGLRWLLGPRGSAPLLAAQLALLALRVDVLVAAPLALGALLGRLHPALCLLGPLYLLRPDGLRQLAFHGLVTPGWWGLLWLLALPCLGRYGGGAPATAAPPAPPTGSQTSEPTA